MFTTILVIGVFAALAKLIVFLKVLGLKRTAKWGPLLDLIGSMFLAWTFFGTLTGMAIAAVGAVMLSVMLHLLKVALRWNSKLISVRAALA